MPYKSCANACISNDRAFAGCVPIAMAQVMRYNEYPNYYNWSAMDLHQGTPTTASFIRDIADAIDNIGDIHYDCDGTGSHNELVAPVLSSYFGYHATYDDDYHYSQLKSSLDDAHPVILSGGHKEHVLIIFNSYAGGHVWVCDGYRVIRQCAPGSEPGFVHYRYLHMNWGWIGGEGDENGGTYGNSFNGWYKDGFNPGNNDFNYQNHMIVNIHPQN